MSYTQKTLQIMWRKLLQMLKISPASNLVKQVSDQLKVAYHDFVFLTTNNPILGLLTFAVSYSYGDSFQVNYLLQNKYFTLNATITVPGWAIDCDRGVLLQSDRVTFGDSCSNWYGFKNPSEGSISTTFNGIGRAQLDFGNCFTQGTVNATLDGTVIASAPANTPSFLVEFDFHVGSFLKITEVGVTIIQFNSLDIIQCNGENEDGKYFFKAY